MLLPLLEVVEHSILVWVKRTSGPHWGKHNAEPRNKKDGKRERIFFISYLLLGGACHCNGMRPWPIKVFGNVREYL